jgi:8-oxo-dGTP pyrophosphatase MutT (NUDIX family)
MAEFCDIYDINRNKTGRLHKRGQPDMNEGDCLLIVIVWIMNNKNEFLISKRAAGIWRSGTWQTTSGCAIAGDDSLSAALRETKEELGITLNPKSGKLLKQYNEGTNLFDIWFFHQDVDISEIVLQPSETYDAVWASRENINRMIDENIFLSGEPPNFEANMSDVSCLPCSVEKS